MKIKKVQTIRKVDGTFVSCPLCGQLTNQNTLSSSSTGNLRFKCKKCNHLNEMKP